MQRIWGAAFTILAICLSSFCAVHSARFHTLESEKERQEKFDKNHPVFGFSSIEKNAQDIKIDQLITKHLDRNYRRANVFDIYPAIIVDKEDHQKIKELNKGSVDLNEYIASDSKLKQLTRQMGDPRAIKEYFDYARKDLEKISGGKYLKALSLNFDGDALHDQAIIVKNRKQDKLFLFIGNNDKMLYLNEFKADYLEALNYGKFPTIVPTPSGKRVINSPALRALSFDPKINPSYIVFYHRERKQWGEFPVRL